MAYNVSELITRSWYLSGIVAREYETPTGGMLNDGLFLLNDLLAFQTVDSTLIPYFTSYNFNGVVGQEQYFVPHLIEIETMTYVYSTTVRYSMIEQSREQYFGSPRTNGINSLPSFYHFEKSKGGADVFMYFFPDQAYPFTIWGKFGLTELAQTKASYEIDLSLIYDRFYLKYLRYALSNYMCNERGVTFAPSAQRELTETIAKLEYLSPMDFTTQKLSSLQTRTGLNWGQINLGQGWTT